VAARAVAGVGPGDRPAGGNTSCAAAVPSGSERDRDFTARMRRVRAIDAQNATMTVEAGLTLADAHTHPREAGFLLPSCRSPPRARADRGHLSTMRGTEYALRHMRKQVSDSKCAAEGEIWNGLRGLRKTTRAMT